jgi:transposase
MDCAYCGSRLGERRPAPYGLCPACHAQLEVDLTAAAVLAARPGPHDAETLADFVLPDGWVAPAPAAAAVPPGE